MQPSIRSFQRLYMAPNMAIRGAAAHCSTLCKCGLHCRAPISSGSLGGGKVKPHPSTTGPHRGGFRPNSVLPEPVSSLPGKTTWLRGRPAEVLSSKSPSLLVSPGGLSCPRGCSTTLTISMASPSRVVSPTGLPSHFRGLPCLDGRPSIQSDRGGRPVLPPRGGLGLC